MFLLACHFLRQGIIQIPSHNHQVTSMLNKYFLLLLFTTAIISTLSACATVKLTHGGEKARLLSFRRSCKLPKTRRDYSTCETDIIATVPRQPTIIAKELQILARNSSVNMGGDTVTPISKD